jgi:serine/threonine protein kinase
MGIMHRDIKPENIFLDSDGHIALGDYGLCKIFPVNKKVNLLSTLSVNEFTYRYMSTGNIGAMWTSVWQAVLFNWWKSKYKNCKESKGFWCLKLDYMYSDCLF